MITFIRDEQTGLTYWNRKPVKLSKVLLNDLKGVGRKFEVRSIHTGEDLTGEVVRQLDQASRQCRKCFKFLSARRYVNCEKCAWVGDELETHEVHA